MSAAPPASTSPGGTGTSAQTAPYAVRVLIFTFQFGSGSYGSQKGSTLTVGGPNANLRAVAHVEYANLPSTGMAQFRIYGLTLDQMNQISVAGQVFDGRQNNSIACQAGDAISGFTTVFNGNIVEAWPDINQPDAPLYVLASPVAQSPIQLKPVPPTTFAGQTSVATALGQMTQAAGVTLENNGVNVMLQSPYFHGTIWKQLYDCVRAADCFAFHDSINNKFAVWPKNGNRSGGPLLISPATGMIDYPKFQKRQIRLRVLFNPNLSAAKAAPGNQVQVQSQLTAACGTFVMTAINHELSSELPKGPWETTILASPVAGT